MNDQNAASAATPKLALNSEAAQLAAAKINPEGVARLRLQSIDAAKRNAGIKYKFDVDPDGTYDLESAAAIVNAVIALDDISLRVPDDESKVLTAIRGGIWDLLK